MQAVDGAFLEHLVEALLIVFADEAEVGGMDLLSCPCARCVEPRAVAVEDDDPAVLERLRLQRIEAVMLQIVGIRQHGFHGGKGAVEQILARAVDAPEHEC